MARLKSHGNHIIIACTLTKYAYCEDRHILRNQGWGWKLWRKLKTDIDYKEAAQRHKDNRKRNFDENPVKAHFMDLLCKLCPSLEKRQFVYTALELLSNDPDGMYSELDDNWHTRGYLDFDDVQSLCRAYNACFAPKTS